MPKIKTTEDITTNEDQTTDVVIKEEIKEVIKPTKEEITKIKLVNRTLDHDI